MKLKAKAALHKIPFLRSSVWSCLGLLLALMAQISRFLSHLVLKRKRRRSFLDWFASVKYHLLVLFLYFFTAMHLLVWYQSIEKGSLLCLL